MVEISTSLLNLEKENSIQTIYNLEVAGTNSFHIDVMDGKFVEADTQEKMREYTENIKSVSNLPIDVHLMVEDVKNYIYSYLSLKPNMIMFHLESCKEKKIRELIQIITKENVKVGISIKPSTCIEEIYEYLPYIHRVLVMTVEPGKGGQEFMPEMLEKIKLLSRYIYENNLETEIEVDGGINDKTAKAVVEVGADILVMGSYILKAEDYKVQIEKVKEMVK